MPTASATGRAWRWAAPASVVSLPRRLRGVNSGGREKRPDADTELGDVREVRLGTGEGGRMKRQGSLVVAVGEGILSECSAVAPPLLPFQPLRRLSRKPGDMAYMSLGADPVMVSGKGAGMGETLPLLASPRPPVTLEEIVRYSPATPCGLRYRSRSSWLESRLFGEASRSGSAFSRRKRLLLLLSSGSQLDDGVLAQPSGASNAASAAGLA